MNITAHNFTKPARLPGEWHQRLTSWFEAALNVAGKAWSKSIPFSIQPSLSHIDVLRFEDAAARMQDSLAGYRITIGENRLPTLLLVPRSLLLVLTLGLLGETVERAPDDRELTDLERSLIEYFLQTQWLPAFKETWPSDVDAIWQSPQTEVNPACSRLFKPDELVLVFTCVVMVPFGEQKLSWLFHKKGLAQLVGLRETTATPADPAHSNLEALVRGMPLDLVVVLGKVELGIAQLARLEVGDVLLLHQQVSEPLTAMVGDEPKFRGWAGRAGTSAAFRIESLIDE